MATEKSRDAFRTISEVAEILDVPAHVLRFWESRFTQVKPVKRAGGRRYYRRTDIALLDGIRKLLHDDGLTIRGVQKKLREDGVRVVAALGRTLDGDADGTGIDATAVIDSRPGTADSETGDAPMAEDVPPASDSSRVLPFARPGAEPGPPDAAATAEAASAGAEPAADPARLADSVPEAPDTAAPVAAPRARPVPESGPEAAGQTPEVPSTGRDTATAADAATPEAPDPGAPDPETPDPETPAREDRTASTPAAQPPVRAIPPTPDLAPDPEDDDPAFAMPGLNLAAIKAAPAVLRPLYERLVAVRRNLGDSGRRGPPV